MSYLGLDYGTKHIGVAVATGPLAEPLTTISDTSQLPTLIASHNITAIIVGDCPSEFLAALQSFKLPVHQVDETLSSHDARAALEHKSPPARAAGEHAAAAAIILQSFLDSQSLTR